MWGYAAAIWRPPADRQGDPAVAPHLGHGTALKLGFISAKTRGAVRGNPGGKLRSQGAQLFSCRGEAAVGDLSHRAGCHQRGGRREAEALTG